MWQPSASIEFLAKRAQVISHIRAHFAACNIIEVHTPQLSSSAATDLQLDSLQVVGMRQNYYLMTSPELFLKRLLCAGLGDCYQLGSVFRDGEQGARHNIEFLLLEWYRLGVSSAQLALEVCALIINLAREFADFAAPQIVLKSYRQVFLEYLHLDIENPEAISQKNLQNLLYQLELRTATQADLAANEALDLLFALKIAPHFAADSLTIINNYPAAQAILARLNPSNHHYADRFEIFWGALELANGFGELQDAREQKNRFINDNHLRIANGKKPMPMDELFLQGLAAGLPDCAGVALGVERVLMRLFNIEHISQTMAFAMDRI